MLRTMFKTCLLAMAMLPSIAHGEPIGFRDFTPGVLPPGFTIAKTGKGQSAVWEIQESTDAGGGSVVVQTAADRTDYRYPLLLHDKTLAVDLDVSVKFKTISGSIDQAAGIVWRYQDANNYYVVRANALEHNVVAYKVQNGTRSSLGIKGNSWAYGTSAPVAKGIWHVLAVTARGDTFAISLDGKKLYDVTDKTFPDAGKVGLWTKADSVTMFDALDVVVK